MHWPYGWAGSRSYVTKEVAVLDFLGLMDSLVAELFAKAVSMNADLSL